MSVFTAYSVVGVGGGRRETRMETDTRNEHEKSRRVGLVCCEDKDVQTLGI
jgi:hypothetical protein